MNPSEALISQRYQKVLSGTETTRLGVALALIDQNSRILLERRSDVGWWGITGGRIDPGETPLECAIREVNEETGLVINPETLLLLDIYGAPEDGRILQYPDCRVHLIDIVYYTFIDAALRLTLSPESLELCFFHATMIPSTIVPPAQRPIHDLVGRMLIQ